jgi:hypothetical protein
VIIYGSIAVREAVREMLEDVLIRMSTDGRERGLHAIVLATLRDEVHLRSDVAI